MGSPSASSSSWRCPACLRPPPSCPPVLTPPPALTILSVVPGLPLPAPRTLLWPPTLQQRPLLGPSRLSSPLGPLVLWGPVVTLDLVGSVDPRTVWLLENKFDNIKK